MTASKDWERLAKLTRERRVELGMTQEDVRAAGGPSTATMRLIEGALQHGYQPATLRDLEKVLRWERGSTSRILAGGDPEYPAPVPARDGAGVPRTPRRHLKALEDADEPGLAPYLQAVRREVYAAADVLAMFPPGDLPGPETIPEIAPLLDVLPGEQAFPGSPTEPAVWDMRDRLTVAERIRLIARLRRMTAEAAPARDRRASG